MARILLIDDDAAVRDAMAFLLRVHDYDVVATDDGAKGIAALDSAPVDLVIVDKFMPKMDGSAVIKAIRAKLPKLPIIAISGATTDVSSRGPDDLPTGPDVGVLTSLPKPFKPEKLLEVIEDLLGGGQ
jgi:CheY-like chemotaxis protein